MNWEFENGDLSNLIFSKFFENMLRQVWSTTTIILELHTKLVLALYVVATRDESFHYLMTHFVRFLDHTYKIHTEILTKLFHHKITFQLVSWRPVDKLYGQNWILHYTCAESLIHTCAEYDNAKSRHMIWITHIMAFRSISFNLSVIDISHFKHLFKHGIIYLGYASLQFRIEVPSIFTSL